MPEDFPHDEWRAARSRHSPALDHPRLAARFLCGITSPSLTRAKLSRHPLFGLLASTPFGVVMRYCE
jgi:ATP-dependent DNA helicase RecQ